MKQRSSSSSGFRILDTAGYRPGSRDVRAIARLGRDLVALIVVAALLVSCGLLPHKPEAVFVLYRERMKAGNVKEARALLSAESRDLAAKIERARQLKAAPESLAFLNILDPVSPPLLVKEGKDSALLQVRTLKGGLRLIRLVRGEKDGEWKIDLTGELESLQSFLQAQRALDLLREQAGEYAASWKAFNDQLRRMRGIAEEEAAPEERRSGPK